MNLQVFYDSETQGLPLFNEPSEHPDQPHIVQLGACLVDMDTRKIVSTLDVIIRPEGWVIPEEVSAIHGITTEMALDVGVPESLAVEMLLDMIGSRTRVGHNEQFDARIVRIACKRFFTEDVAEQWKGGAAECTAAMSSPILALPPTDKMKRAGFTKHKTPKLSEAYQHFTGRELENAHSALGDVHACIAVYFGVKDLQQRQALAA